MSRPARLCECLLPVFCLFLFVPRGADAASHTLTFRHQHHLFFLHPNDYADWYATGEEWLYRGVPIKPLHDFRVDGDDIPPLPAGVEYKKVPGWDRDAVRKTLRQHIASVLDREQGTVTIVRSETGSVIFRGVGMPGREVDLELAVELAIAALKNDMTDIVLPVKEIQPQIIVEDAELRSFGIREVVAIGESDFSGSPLARKHNISVGLQKFNGHVIPQGETFSFNDVLGPVNASTGYRRELVILGERTLPDYGGGLCQVSTTAYRAAWEYGFPIADRRNHSYAVRYYGPQGTDATIYPPSTDMQFVNDGSGAILIQTHMTENHAYFIYYGTADSRETDIMGPYTWGHTSPPPERTEYTADIPAGTMRKVGEAVPGLKAAWYRSVTLPTGEELLEPTYSFYEARPRFTQIGVEPLSPLLFPPDEDQAASEAAIRGQ